MELVPTTMLYNKTDNYSGWYWKSMKLGSKRHGNGRKKAIIALNLRYHRNYELYKFNMNTLELY